MYARVTKEESTRGKAGFESMLSRFNRGVQAYGIMGELRRRQFYEKPSTARNRKIRDSKTRRRKESAQGRV